MEVHLDSNWLTVEFMKPYSCLSWAVCGGGHQTARQVLWCQVRNEDLPQNIDPEIFLKTKLQERGFPNAVAMLTSADFSHYQDVMRTHNEVKVRCIATVGMSNALRIGDPSVQTVSLGTINLLCAISVPLAKSSMIEALSLVVEARTVAVLDAGIPSIQTALPATGTGTDCVVLAAVKLHQEMRTYSGKHTVLGSLIGETVYEAVSAGLRVWKAKKLKKEVLI